MLYKTMIKLKKLLIICTLGVIFAFIFCAANFVISEILCKSSINTLSPTANAFLGAFFAFLFVRLGDFLNVYREKIKIHHNALVKLQYMCNEYLNIIDDNKNVIANFCSLIDSTLSTNIVPIYINRFHPFEIDKNILLSFQDITLINKTFTYNDDLISANTDMANFTGFYTEMRQGLLQKNISPQDYKENMKRMLDEFKKLEKFFIHLDKKTDEMAAITRCMLNDSIFKIFFKNKYPSIKQIQDEIMILSKEREKIRKESEKEKKEIFGDLK